MTAAEEEDEAGPRQATTSAPSDGPDGPDSLNSPEGVERQPRPRRPGGRTARVRSQVLDSVGPLLVEFGYDGLTIDAVAARSGVHRATVYRRWRDVGGLLADVLDAAGDDTWRPADTGSLEGDLTALNEEVQEAMGEDPPVAYALIAASFRSDEAASALHRFWEDRYERCAEVVRRAVDREELPGPLEAVDARGLLVTATAPVYHERVLLKNDPDPGLPVRAARTAVLAAQAGAFTSNSSKAPGR